MKRPPIARLVGLGFVLLTALGLSACSREAPGPTGVSARLMKLTAVTPSSGPPEGGSPVTILGISFGVDRRDVRVTFGGEEADITSVSDREVSVVTPGHPLRNPEVAESVVVRVSRVSDGESAWKDGGFSYTRTTGPMAFFGVSPREAWTGETTRLEILVSPDAFSFPAEVSLLAPGCAETPDVRDVAIQPARITASVSVPASSCLANRPLDVVVRMPLSGRELVCRECLTFLPR